MDSSYRNRMPAPNSQEKSREGIPNTSSTSTTSVGFQKDPNLQERHWQQQRVERKITNAPIDLGDKLNAGKLASEQGEQSSSNVDIGTPTPSPTQPDARRQKVAKKWLRDTAIRHNRPRRSAPLM